MNREELRKKFNKYTKEQIIEGMFHTYVLENLMENILHSIEYYVNQKKIEDEYKEFEIVSNNADKAMDDYLNYINELKIKYGNEIKIGQLTKSEFDKLLKVTSDYEKENKDYLENIEKDKMRCYKNEQD